MHVFVALDHVAALLFACVVILFCGLSFLWVRNRRLQTALHASTMTDPLTRMFSRSALKLMGTRELQRTGRRNLPCSAVMLDVDRFAEINDRLGYAAGDAALCSVALALNRTLRATDIGARLEDDAFFVLLPEADEAALEQIVARIREATSRLHMQTVEGGEFPVVVSIGYATLHGAAAKLEALMNESSRTLLLEKETRRAHYRAAMSLSSDAVHPEMGGAHVQPSKA